MAKKVTNKGELAQLDMSNLAYTKDKIVAANQLNDLYLRKGVGAVQIRIISGKRSLLQRKAINALLKVVGDMGFDKQSYLTTRIAFSAASGFNSNDVEHLKATAAAITDLRVVFDVMNGENIRHVGSVNLFSAIVFRSDGQIYIEMPEITKKMLQDDEKFALINMQIHAQFESLYAYILYENCLLYVSEGETPSWTIEEWKKLLEIDEEQSTYQEFKFFNNKVIKFSVNEVNKVSDILIEPIYHKKGRTVTNISFKIEKKPQAMFDFLAKNSSLELEQRVVNFGVSEKVAQKLVQEFDADRIIGNIEYTEKRFSEGKVTEDGLAGFLVRAIEEDYKPKESPLVKKAKEKKQADEAKKAAAALEKAKTDERRGAEMKAENAKAQQYLDGLDEHSKVDLLESFSHELSKSNPLVYKQYKSSGLRSTMAKSSLMKFIKENHLQP